MSDRKPALIKSGALRFWDALHSLLREWRAESARAELRRLSDRTLADIGLTRPQIESLYR